MASGGERGVELAEVIRQLRRELKAAAAEGAGAGEALQFEVGPVEIEATVAISREAGAHGKVRFWVVEAGADGKLARSATQRIALTLHPKAVAQDGTTRSPLISGDEIDGER
ncbi:trypco2 family protein [Streptomyces sp. NPDC005426]|uniref:trypco2 family protein n=1 Tax=Streptomyces sp. NPDC005426 TaxID=3155344 RepID=UPI0033A7C105